MLTLTTCLPRNDLNQALRSTANKQSSASRPPSATSTQVRVVSTPAASVDQPLISLLHLPDISRPRIPALAVASGSFIYIYRNFRPHYKFTVPSIEIDVEELKVWEALAKCSIEIPAALTQLTSMR